MSRGLRRWLAIRGEPLGGLPRASCKRPPGGRLLLVAAACVLVPACTADSPQRTPALKAGGAPEASAALAGREAPGATGRTEAKGPGRRHPFAPVVDAAARQAQQGSASGPLKLQAVFGGAERAAIIQEGQRTWFVHEGDSVCGLAVLAIREGEVLLGLGTRKQILPLYEPWAGGKR